MWTLQRTSAPKGPRGARVFSLFKMERANPSPAVCDKRKKKTHRPQRVFVRESLLPECLWIALFARMHAHVRAWAAHAQVCVICTCQMHRDDKRGRVMLFSASKYHDWNIYCLHTFDKSPLPRFTLQWEKKIEAEKTSQRLEYVHCRCNTWAGLIPRLRQ